MERDESEYAYAMLISLPKWGTGEEKSLSVKVDKWFRSRARGGMASARPPYPIGLEQAMNWGLSQYSLVSESLSKVGPYLQDVNQLAQQICCYYLFLSIPRPTYR